MSKKDEGEYKLDRSAFTMHSHEDPVRYNQYWLSMPPSERLRAAWYLISMAYGFNVNKPLKMNKSEFSMRSKENG